MDVPKQPHWSFVPPVANELPVVADAQWVRNPIDAFVLANLEAQAVAPAAPASAEKLLRRVTLDLTGLPPTLDEIDAFVADPSDAAYDAVVTRLLDSKRYAEHMTAAWLDIARYSDTDGFQYDINRPAWPWRDWVLTAFDSNMPWDEFTIEQLAGDLLPSPTPDTILATAFNRNHAIQGENGLLLNSFRDRYVTDRVETLGKGWLGLTLGCAKCHDHKYDPVLATDFYKLYDCFNQLDERDNGPTSEFQPTAELTSPLADNIKDAVESRIAELQEAGAAEGKVGELDWERDTSQKTFKIRVMQDMEEKHDTQVLAVGRYDAPYGDPVRCSAPASLPPFPDGAPDNRLGLAQWLVMPGNPLTSRVTVNRFWMHHFGRGLVPAIDNFGVQTEKPKQLALLDWLAVHFIESGWDLKALHRLIVTSSTYRQDSASDEQAIELDPRNDMYARGPRFRLPAEVVRDVPLAVSGLLINRFGGPPTYPYQPEGLWEELSWESNELHYPQLIGDSLYRRSVYSFWKKTLPPPLMTLFDAPDREYSVAYREVGITPLQPLALLNDPAFIHAGRQLAVDVLQAESGVPDAAISRAFRMLTARLPNEKELELLLGLYDNQLTAVTDAAAGDESVSETDASISAMAQVMRVLFNLNETISQE